MARILIIEDDRAIALGLRLNLRKDGHEVRMAQDGDIGLRLALEPDVDLIVLDVMLPGRNGYELLKEVRRAIALTRRLPPGPAQHALEQLARFLAARCGAEDSP